MENDIEDIKKKILPVLKEAGITRSSLFGSYVRGENTENSDIDILVEPTSGMDLFDLADLKTKLEKVSGRGIDIITFNSIHPLLKNYILKEQIQII